MQHWHAGQGTQFSNSTVCYGEEFAPAGAPLNVAVITIKARYPEIGYMYNLEAYEMAYVVKGTGVVMNKSGEHRDLSVGDVVFFEPNERIAWDGDMQLVMPCSPPFDPQKHMEEKE